MTNKIKKTTLKESIISYCSHCLGERNHFILYKKEKEMIFKPSNISFHYNYVYYVLDCQGCNHTSFRLDELDFGMDGNSRERSKKFDKKNIFPLYLKNRDTLRKSYLIPQKIVKVYYESVEALKNDCRLLTAAGLRAIIEAVCTDKGITGRNIQIKIDKLNTLGFLSKKETDRLHAVRFLGNDAIHEIDVPDENKILSALTIIEHLLNNLYIIDKIVSQDIDLLITDFVAFENMLDIQISNFKKGDIVDLKTLIGKQSRRISQSDLIEFEKKLIEEINDDLNPYLLLSENITNVTTSVQNYIIDIDTPLNNFVLNILSLGRPKDSNKKKEMVALIKKIVFDTKDNPLILNAEKFRF